MSEPKRERNKGKTQKQTERHWTPKSQTVILRISVISPCSSVFKDVWCLSPVAASRRCLGDLLKKKGKTNPIIPSLSYYL